MRVLPVLLLRVSISSLLFPCLLLRWFCAPLGLLIVPDAGDQLASLGADRLAVDRCRGHIGVSEHPCGDRGQRHAGLHCGDAEAVAKSPGAGLWPFDACIVHELRHLAVCGLAADVPEHDRSPARARVGAPYAVHQVEFMDLRAAASS